MSSLAPQRYLIERSYQAVALTFTLRIPRFTESREFGELKRLIGGFPYAFAVYPYFGVVPLYSIFCTDNHQITEAERFLQSLIRPRTAIVRTLHMKNAKGIAVWGLGWTYITAGLQHEEIVVHQACVTRFNEISAYWHEHGLTAENAPVEWRFDGPALLASFDIPLGKDGKWAWFVIQQGILSGYGVRHDMPYPFSPTSYSLATSCLAFLPEEHAFALDLFKQECAVPPQIYTMPYGEAQGPAARVLPAVIVAEAGPQREDYREFIRRLQQTQEEERPQRRGKKGG